MSLEYIKTLNNIYIVDVIQDKLHDSMKMLYGRELHLKVERIKTEKNPKGVIQYPDYIGKQPVQVCHLDDIEERRTVTDQEQSLFSNIDNGNGLNKENREYLREKYLKE